MFQFYSIETEENKGFNFLLEFFTRILLEWLIHMKNS